MDAKEFLQKTNLDDFENLSEADQQAVLKALKEKSKRQPKNKPVGFIEKGSKAII